MKWTWQWPWSWSWHRHDVNGDAAHAATVQAQAQLLDAQERTAEVDRLDRLAGELTRRANWFTRDFERTLRRKQGRGMT